MSDYQGWTNYETWNVALWIDNDQGLYGYVTDLTREAMTHPNPRITLADYIKDEIEQGMPELTGCWSDLLQSAFNHVNWHQIADSWIDNYQSDETEEDN